MNHFADKWAVTHNDELDIAGEAMGRIRLRDQQDWQICKEAMKNSAYIFDYINMTRLPEKTCHCWVCRLCHWMQESWCVYGA